MAGCNQADLSLDQDTSRTTSQVGGFEKLDMSSISVKMVAVEFEPTTSKSLNGGMVALVLRLPYCLNHLSNETIK